MNNNLIQLECLKPFGRFIYTIGVLPTSYIFSMTYEEQLIWFCNYLEQVIKPAINTNALATKELQDKYVEFTEQVEQLIAEMQSYLDNYFENLDVQEEINNKLDEMADNGELTEIIAQYIQLAGILAYNTLNDLINAENIVNGSICKTLGFRTYNDGAGANYKIRNITNEDVVDNMKIIAIANSETLIAELLPSDYITPQMLGANCDGETDDSSYVLEAFNIARDRNITLLLNKIYYINDNITLDGNAKSINIDQTNGYFIIDKTILLYDITNSKVNLILNGGGSGDKDDCSVIFEKCFECDFNLKSNNVNQTAFYMHDYYGSLSRNTAIIKGSNNIRTLLHQSVSPEIQGMFFGSYIDIEDRLAEYPIHFEKCNDITIQHIENLFNDETYTKNSIEFYDTGSIHIGVLALGGLCKNIVYLNNSNVTINDCLLVNGNEETNPPAVTGIFCKNDVTLNIFNLRNVRCLYAINASEILYPKQLHIDKIILDGNANITPKGIYITGLATDDNYPLAYNNLNNINTNFTFESSYGSINARAYKKNGIMYVNGYIIINSDYTGGDVLFTIKSTETNNSVPAQAKDRVDFIATRGTNALFMHFSSGTTEIKHDNNITASGNAIAFNFSYPTKHYDGL